ncbi:MAG: hypothetical protein ACK5MF_17785 [Vibrio sp.]|uniref:hypothetical protein n=1 Tax=Vibrio sp. TaxID=678 RepID=UPI003A8A5DC6
MTTQVFPKQVMNLKQRMKVWERKRIFWLLAKVPICLAATLGISLAAFYGASTMDARFETFWFEFAMIVGLSLGLPLCHLNYPKKPTQYDVETEVKLRKAFGMDATISAEGN